MQPDRAAAVAPRRLGGVLDQVQEHLHQLIRVGKGRGQRGVVILDNGHVRRKADQRGFARTVQRVMDIDRAAVRRAQIAELLYLLQQLHDPPGFFHDQIGQLAVFGAKAHRQQLRRAGNTGKRVLDLMRQHFGHADGGFRGRGHVHRPPQPVGDFARRDQQQHDFGIVVHGRDLDVALHRRAFAGCHIHIIDEQRRLIGARPCQGFVHRRVDMQPVKGGHAGQGSGRGIQKGLCRRVDGRDLSGAVDQKGRGRQRGPDDAGDRIGGPVLCHAAACCCSAKAACRARITRAGLSAVRIGPRNAVRPASCRYQPRCLRATLMPSSSP